MKKYLLIGTLIFVGIVVALAPARLVTEQLPANAPVQVLSPKGSLWTGAGLLVAGGENLGHLDWQIKWLDLLTLNLTYNWQLAWQSAPGTVLHGAVTGTFSDLQTMLRGPLPASTLAPWLRRYNLYLEGDFDLQIDHLSFDHAGALRSMKGTIDWQGGRVRYTLSGLLNEATLPPVKAQLKDGLPQHEVGNTVLVPGQGTASPVHAVAYADGFDTPLMFATQLTNGYVKIAVTKLLTRLVDQPWPGSDPDHTIIIEVEEKLF